MIEFEQIDLLELEMEIFKRSYFEFYKEAVKILEPETDWLFNWHIEYICNELKELIFNVKNKTNEGKKLMVNIPPGSSKSMIFSVCFLPWAWLHCPTLRIGVHCYNADLSTGFCVKARTLIESDWYQERFCEYFTMKKDQNTKTFFMNEVGGEMRAQVNTGNHLDLIVVDDIMNPKIANSPADKQNALDYFFVTLPSRYKDRKRGVTVVVQQRLAEDDLCGEIEKRQLNYDKIVIPATLNDKVWPAKLKLFYQEGLFWPQRYDKNTLEELRKAMLEHNFETQFNQNAQPLEGSIIKKEWFKFFSRQNEEISEIAKQPRHFWTDTAYGKEKSDNSASICYSEYKGNLYIWAVKTWNLAFPEFIREHKKFLMQYGYADNSLDIFEPKASGVSIVQQLKSEVLSNGKRINVIEDDPPKDSKLTRITAIAPIIQAERIFLFEEFDFDSFLYEIVTFDGLERAGRKDDQVDCLEGAIRSKLKPPSYIRKTKEELLSILTG